jgi:hypothetical protein
MGERNYSSYSYLTSALDGGEWSVSCPSSTLPPGKEPPVPTGQEAGLAPEPGLDTEAKGKSSACRGSNPGRPVRSQDTILTELPRLPREGVPTEIYIYNTAVQV